MVFLSLSRQTQGLTNNVQGSGPYLKLMDAQFIKIFHLFISYVHKSPSSNSTLSTLNPINAFKPYFSEAVFTLQVP